MRASLPGIPPRIYGRHVRRIEQRTRVLTALLQADGDLATAARALLQPTSWLRRYLRTHGFKEV